MLSHCLPTEAFRGFKSLPEHFFYREETPESSKEFQMEEAEDLRIQLKDDAGNVVFDIDFATFKPDLRQYAERFGLLSLRSAAEYAVCNLLENLAIDPEATAGIFDQNPWHYRGSFEDGSGFEVDMEAYAAEIQAHAMEHQCIIGKAFKAVLMENIEAIRPTIKWIDSPPAE